METLLITAPAGADMIEALMGQITYVLRRLPHAIESHSLEGGLAKLTISVRGVPSVHAVQTLCAAAGVRVG